MADTNISDVVKGITGLSAELNWLMERYEDSQSFIVTVKSSIAHLSTLRVGLEQTSTYVADGNNKRGISVIFRRSLLHRFSMTIGEISQRLKDLRRKDLVTYPVFSPKVPRKKLEELLEGYQSQIRDLVKDLYTLVL